MTKPSSILTVVLVSIFSQFGVNPVSAAENIVVVPLLADDGVLDFVWLPAADVVVRHGDSSQAHTETESNGRTCVEQDQSGSLLVDVFFPIQIGVPQGRNLRVASAQIYYAAPAASAFINRTRIEGRDFFTGASTALVTDTTQRTSATFTSYSVDVTANELVTEVFAPTTIALQLRMTAIGSAVCLYGVRLQLG